MAPLTKQRQGDLLAVFAHPADLPCRYPSHERVRRHVAPHDGAGGDEGEGTDGDATDDRAVRAQRCTAPHPGVTVLVLAVDEGAGVMDVGKHHARTAEHALLQSHVVVYRY